MIAQKAQRNKLDYSASQRFNLPKHFAARPASWTLRKTKPNCCWHSETTWILNVLNNFMKKICWQRSPVILT